MEFYGTRDAAKILGVSVAKLQRAIWNERLDPPEKGPGGAFLWTLGDLERASWQLLNHSLKPGRDIKCRI